VTDDAALRVSRARSEIHRRAGDVNAHFLL
jgi:hypothetical protein